LYIFKFESFTTLCELQFDTQNKEYADYVAHIILQEVKRLEQKYSFFASTSDLFKLNNHRISQTILLDEEFCSLINLALFYNQKTLGAFDVTIDGDINLTENQLTFSNKNTKIDFGGLVKEYAVDLAISILKDYQISSALVNFGGDLASFGTYYGKLWKVGIEDPNNTDITIATIDMNNNSLCSSGHSKRYQIIEDTKISHIKIKEKNNYSQVSIVAPTTVDAGVWSTAILSKPSLTPPSHIKIIKLI